MTEFITCTWKRGDPTPNLNRALSKLQGEMDLMVKGQTGQVGGGIDKATGEQKSGRKYKYGDLGSAIDAAREGIGKYGLAVTQEVDTQEDGVVVRTIVLHESGEEREQSLKMPIIARTAQAYGSATTYGRRYAYCAALGIAGEADDDAKSASEPMLPSARAPRRPEPIDPALVVNSFVAIGVTTEQLAAKLGHPPTHINEEEAAMLKLFYAETVRAKKAAETKVDPDESARIEVQRQAEAALEVSTPKTPEQMTQALKNSVFADFIGKVRNAQSQAAVAALSVEFAAATAAKWTPGDAKAFNRACEDRVLILKDAAAEAKKPKTPRIEDVP